MRATFGAALVVLMTVQAAHAQQPAIATAKVPPAESFAMVLGHAGYFVASDPNFKPVYGDGLAYGGEFRVALPGMPREIASQLVAWFEGSYRQRTGSLTYTHESTKMSVIGAEVGALYLLMRGPTSPYIGAGVGYYAFDEKNAIGDAKQNKAGYCVLGGVSTTMKTRWVIDVGVKYSSAKMKPADISVDIGGTTIRFGAGLRF